MTSLGLVIKVLFYSTLPLKIYSITLFSSTKYLRVPLLTFILPLPQFRALAPMYYRGSAAAIIVYDITKEVFMIYLLAFWQKKNQVCSPSE